ncbi:MAG: SDR family oxidoreductase [Anaerolineaceae bacterium]|nr:SDR family oxidoreductase [Anaerolineaceae bacterium]
MVPNAFQNQVVIITGASAGIGAALAEELANQGARLVIAARREDRLEEVAKKCRALGSEVMIVPTDVSDEAQCKWLVERTIEQYGQLNMLINNAGLAATALFDQFPDLNLFRHVINVNFYGVIHCAYYALPYLQQTQGRVVTISSMGGKSAIPYNTPYCASKYAIHGFMDALRMETKSQGVSVTTICPWWVVTEFHEAQMDKNGISRGANGRKIYHKRMMTAKRCAEITLIAAYKRKREILMGPGTLTVWLKLLSPALLDWLAIKIFIEPAIRRTRNNN